MVLFGHKDRDRNEASQEKMTAKDKGNQKEVYPGPGGGGEGGGGGGKCVQAAGAGTSTVSILTDQQIGDLFENLTLDELESFRGALKEALHEYSVGTQSRTDDEQPERQSIHSSITGATTLFMPSRAPAGMGVKVITLTTPKAQDQATDATLAHPPHTQRSASPVQTRGTAPAETRPPTGAITLFNPDGTPLALMHASHLTAFRTALASLCLVQRRESVKVITVFGSGLQAYYHVRLTLMLRGATIRQVNIVNRSFSRSVTQMLTQFVSGISSATKQREGWTDCRFGVITPTYSEYGRLLKEQVRQADVIFCATPSTQPLFDHTFLTNPEGRRKKRGRLVVAIGSYTPDMAELPTELLLQATKRQEGRHLHFHKHAIEGGVVIVDTLDGALREAGEVIAAGLKPDQLVELGELVMLKRMHLQDAAAGTAGDEEDDNAVANDDGDDRSTGSSRSRRSSIQPASSSSPSSVEVEKLEKLDLNGPPAMATVFGGGGGPGAPPSIGVTPDTVVSPASRGSSPNRSSTRGSFFRSSSRSSRKSTSGATIATTNTSSTSTSASSTLSTTSAGKILRGFLKRQTSSVSTSSAVEPANKMTEEEQTLATWLQAGNVIYKSVGLGVMDLAVGMHLVQFARAKGIGTHVEGF